MQLVIDTAVEWWSNGKPRTKERLRDIITHYALAYGIDDKERIETMLEEAWNKVPEWKKDTSSV